MKSLILLFLISNIALAQRPQDIIKEQNSYKDNSPKVESQNSITAKELINKNCNEKTTRKDIETADGTTYDTYTCSKNMLIYVNYGDRIHFKVLYKMKNNKIIDLISVSSWDEVKKLKEFMLNKYKASSEYKKQEELRNKQKAAQLAKKEAYKQKLAQREIERKAIIKELLQ